MPKPRKVPARTWQPILFISGIRNVLLRRLNGPTFSERDRKVGVDSVCIFSSIEVPKGFSYLLFIPTEANMRTRSKGIFTDPHLPIGRKENGSIRCLQVHGIIAVHLLHGVINDILIGLQPCHYTSHGTMFIQFQKACLVCPLRCDISYLTPP